MRLEVRLHLIQFVNSFISEHITSVADHKERSFLYFELEDRLYGITPYYFAKVVLAILNYTTQNCNTCMCNTAQIMRRICVYVYICDSV